MAETEQTTIEVLLEVLRDPEQGRQALHALLDHHREEINRLEHQLLAQAAQVTTPALYMLATTQDGTVLRLNTTTGEAVTLRNDALYPEWRIVREP